MPLGHTLDARNNTVCPTRQVTNQQSGSLGELTALYSLVQLTLGDTEDTANLLGTHQSVTTDGLLGVTVEHFKAGIFYLLEVTRHVWIGIHG